MEKPNTGEYDQWAPLERWRDRLPLVPEALRPHFEILVLASRLDGTVTGPVSALQRHLRLGYQAACALVQEIADAGLISEILAPDGRRKLRLPHLESTETAET